MSSVLDSPPTPSVTASLDVLEGALAVVATLVGDGLLETVSGDDLLAVTARLHRLASRLQAVAVTAASEVRDGDVATCHGFTGTTRWLEVDAGLSATESRAAVGLGEKLQWEFTATRDAWLAGRVSQAAVREITTGIPRALKGVPDVDYAATSHRVEALALDVAQAGATVADVRRLIARCSFVADPQGAADAVLAARESEYLRFTPTAEGVEVRGLLTHETGAAVLTAFDQRVDLLHRTGALAEPDLAGVERPIHRLRVGRREHVNAQVLADLVTALLDDGLLGSKHAQRPHVTVTVDADDHRAGLGGEILLPGFGRVSVPGTSIDRILCDAEVHVVITARTPPPPGSLAPPGSIAPHELRTDRTSAATGWPGSVPRSQDPPWRPRIVGRADGGLPVWNSLGERVPGADELGRDTDLVAVTERSDDLDDPVSWWNRFRGEPARHVLDVGRSFRTAPPKIRRALTVRDGGCVAPGCGVDPSRCEAHHVTYWEHLGETSISNLVLLCGRHHHAVHAGRLRLDRDERLAPGSPRYITATVVTAHDAPAAVPGARVRNAH